jgi:hypothetical protein
MSDKPRPWPNNAKEARDRAAELAAEGIRALRPLIFEDRIFTEKERLQRESRALQALMDIIRYMEREGAQTRPE